MIDEGSVQTFQITKLQSMRFDKISFFLLESINSIPTVTLLVDLHGLGSFSFGKWCDPRFQVFLSYLKSIPTLLLTAATINLSIFIRK